MAKASRPFAVETGDTLLHVAAAHGQLEAARELVRLGGMFVKS